MAKRSTLVFELEFELGRDQVVSAAQRAIADAREADFEVSLSLVRRLLRVARSAPEFALGDWWIDGRCGCLIGNLYGRQVDTAELSGAEFAVGMKFDEALVSRLPAAAEAAWLENVNPATEHPHRSMVVRAVGSA